jgi:hypothetical protein
MSDLTDFCDRIRTVADEAFGPFPHMTAVEALDEIEKGIAEYKRAVSVALAVLEVIADQKAELPNDGRETSRIYEDMALEAIGKIHGSNPTVEGRPGNGGSK